ncbi:hypothetical protein EDB83DRAFT_2494494 [Lactarius deliciosus]|nr:hypothetical protein EDB83DRAFT_2494494 [Lactarius deliciosus]
MSHMLPSADSKTNAGAMTHITLHYLVVNSFDTVISMLEAKSTIYSDRLGEIVGWNDGVAVGRYGERIRDLRHLLHQAMGTPASTAKRIPVIEREVHRFVQRLLDTLFDQFTKNLRRYVYAFTPRRPRSSSRVVP